MIFDDIFDIIFVKKLVVPSKSLPLAKNAFLPQKKHPKYPKRLIFIWEKATFFFEQLFPVVARTW